MSVFGRFQYLFECQVLIVYLLPQNVPVAIEYPTANEQTILDGIQALKVFS